MRCNSLPFWMSIELIIVLYNLPTHQKIPIDEDVVFGNSPVFRKREFGNSEIYWEVGKI